MCRRSGWRWACQSSTSSERARALRRRLGRRAARRSEPGAAPIPAAGRAASRAASRSRGVSAAARTRLGRRTPKARSMPRQQLDPAQAVEPGRAPARSRAPARADGGRAGARRRPRRRSPAPPRRRRSRRGGPGMRWSRRAALREGSTVTAKRGRAQGASAPRHGTRLALSFITTKPEVREIARELGLPVAEKSDSQEICFVPNGDYAAFMDAYLREQGAGRADARRDRDDRRTHARRALRRASLHCRPAPRLGIATGEPLYVIATDPASQRVIVGAQRRIAARRLIASRRELDLVARRWRAGARAGEDPQQARGRGGDAAPRPTRLVSRCVSTSRSAPSRRARRAVFYDGDLVLGGGWIE